MLDNNGVHPVTYTAKTAQKTYKETQEFKEPKLQPCPFCGKELNITDEDTSYPIKGGLWNLGCAGVYGGCDTFVIGENEMDCVKKWNTRDGRV